MERKLPKKMKRGKFIVIEGGVGSGNSTVFNKLKRRFKDWSFYREPGSTPFGERIRKAVQGIYHYPVDKYAAMFAYSASRANLIFNRVLPDIKNGKTVVLDRYWYTSYSYQGTEGVPKKIIIGVNKIATGNLIPDLILHMDQDPKIGMARKEGKKDTDRYDIKKLRFHESARKGYYELAKILKGKWKIIDASQNRKKVFEDTMKFLRKAGMIS